jgi:hypothetical protein
MAVVSRFEILDIFPLCWSFVAAADQGGDHLVFEHTILNGRFRSTIGREQKMFTFFLGGNDIHSSIFYFLEQAKITVSLHDHLVWVMCATYDTVMCFF